jgi:hypothetical protein
MQIHIDILSLQSIFILSQQPIFPFRRCPGEESFPRSDEVPPALESQFVVGLKLN